MIQSSFLSFTELFQYMQKQLPQFITSSSQQQQRDVMMGDSVETGGGVGQWYPGGQNNGSGGGVVAIAGTGANGANGGGVMLNMLNMYTSTVLKILQQAVEEIKRGMVLIKQQQQLQLELLKQGGGNSNSNKQQQQQVVLSNNINQIQRQKLQASIAYTRTVTSANNSKGIGKWNSGFLFPKKLRGSIEELQAAVLNKYLTNV